MPWLRVSRCWSRRSLRRLPRDDGGLTGARAGQEAALVGEERCGVAGGPGGWPGPASRAGGGVITARNTSRSRSARPALKETGALWLNLGDTYSAHARYGAPAKSLLLGPERLLLALSADGWIVRNKVVWSKPNPMPTSVKDRLSSTWEPLYLLTNGPRYVFDLDAIRIPARSRMNRPAVVGTTKYGSDGPRDWSGPLAGSNNGLEAMKRRGASSHPLGKNPGDVWEIATASYRGAHFAPFPEALVERPLLATCPERVCHACSSPWRRPPVDRSQAVPVLAPLVPSCGCHASWSPGVVLDPFMGAGTVAVVAERLHRHWVGVELNPEFAAQAQARVAGHREPSLAAAA